jgi:murein DD-endopeptidase MepM/ murein hydrolase activator NlpD
VRSRLLTPGRARIVGLARSRGGLAAAGVLVGALIGAGAVVGPVHREHAAVRARLADAVPRLAEQEALLESYAARARELRAEIDGWRQIHARILDPFGPDPGLARRAPGQGGGVASLPQGLPVRGEPARDELAHLSSIVQEQTEELRALEQFLSRAGRLLASLPSRWPVRGSVNSDFGQRLSPWLAGAEFHSGMDIGAPIGTPVRAPAPGSVVFAGPLAEFGLTVILDHGTETRSLYGHLSRLTVAADQKVQRGDVIALTGNTGRSSGPHLHYEIQVAGQPVNPNTYLWE